MLDAGGRAKPPALPTPASISQHAVIDDLTPKKLYNPTKNSKDSHSVQGMHHATLLALLCKADRTVQGSEHRANLIAPYKPNCIVQP